MKIEVRRGLLFVEAVLVFGGREIRLNNVLLDTGSAGSIFSISVLAGLEIKPEPCDLIHRIRGVGGSEFVFSKKLERLVVNPITVDAFVIEVGVMDYGLNIDGILGCNFLLQNRAVIDLAELNLSA